MPTPDHDATLRLAERYAAGIGVAREEVEAIRDFARFRKGHGAPVELNGRDDVDLRAHLLELRTAGAGEAEIVQRLAAPRRFYAWAAAKGEIASDPFALFHLERPVLPADQVRRREERLVSDPRERELARLRALHHLAEELNRTSDVSAALAATLQALGAALGLPTGWAFLLAESGLATTPTV